MKNDQEGRLRLSLKCDKRGPYVTCPSCGMRNQFKYSELENSNGEYAVRCGRMAMVSGPYSRELCGFIFMVLVPPAEELAVGMVHES